MTLRTPAKAAWIATAMTAAIIGAVAVPAYSQKPSPSASASASAFVSASASASPHAPTSMFTAAMTGKSLEKMALPTDKSPPPKVAEWQQAPEVALVRPLPTGCKAHLVREWLRVRCPRRLRGVVQISGARAGTSLYARDHSFSNGAFKPDVTEVLLPIRRGERRVLEVVGGPFGLVGAMSVSVQWLDDQPGPWVTFLADADHFLAPY